ncbi:5-dehydro-4-deoxy-D-glucuronate isomerase [Rheinheimera sp. UJ51]|uniref:5-dehydro-4-deoxy-D-glucuronate isomerase n=1 Tax=unclassified Rheinheimera TaxID=115860 RepID=UPI001E3B44C2|nr:MULTISPECIES: 5-dehydro-4-deoxy-D-glucuronate isomerase [unclassified Rheinheimera]MCC5453278.1 5-dehydro-4-deoxy-D-glucuronate isomerase [Rheinheimera sp. UJ51]MCF4010948.1 5-dehydro-4-deoxy-D-glucuronate isomerase [Rheinheimera sp. UJ63]
MEFMFSADKRSYKTMRNDELREAFVTKRLFEVGKINLTYTDVDRCVIGGITPSSTSIDLPTHKELAADYFCQRREVGIINIGGSGCIIVDGETYPMANKDSLYIARGSERVSFSSDDSSQPAKFYLASYPAHRITKTVHVPKDKAQRIELGSQQTSNERTIFQSIRPGIVDTCQLVMGITELKPGSVWNTKPPHTHFRRTEVYMYFDLPEEERVFHLMGEPSEIKTLSLSPEVAIASPSWSIHSGVGTTNYTFIWAMGGENQEFDDMDHLTVADLG